MEFDSLWLPPQTFTVQFRINSRTVCIPVVLLYLLWSAEGVDMSMLGNYTISEKLLFEYGQTILLIFHKKGLLSVQLLWSYHIINFWLIVRTSTIYDLSGLAYNPSYFITAKKNTIPHVTSSKIYIFTAPTHSSKNWIVSIYKSASWYWVLWLLE